MKKLFSFVFLFTIVSILYAKEISSEKMLNAFTMGMDQKGLEIALEIISSDKYSEEKEYTLFTVSEYFFHKSIKNENFSSAQRAFTFYSKFIREFPKSEKIEIARLRINFLNSLFPLLSISGEYLSELFSESYAVEKLGMMGQFYTSTEDREDYAKRKMLIDTESSFQVANKYYDTIILNYPRFSQYGYYLKILSYINESWRWNMDSFKQAADLKRFKLTDSYWIRSYKTVHELLLELREKYPNSDLTFDAHVMLAGTVWNAGITATITKNTKKEIVKPLLEYVLSNDKNKLGYRFNIVKEFVIRNL